MTAHEFLVDYYGTDNCCVNYKPYAVGKLVWSMPFYAAEKMLEADIEEMTEILRSAGYDNPREAGQLGAFRIWKEHHLVKF